MLWTEKYRPKLLHHLIGQESFKMDAENWIEINDMPNVLLYGTAGIGKTAAAYVLAREMLGKDFESKIALTSFILSNTSASSFFTPGLKFLFTDT